MIGLGHIRKISITREHPYLALLDHHSVLNRRISPNCRQGAFCHCVALKVNQTDVGSESFGVLHRRSWFTSVRVHDSVTVRIIAAHTVFTFQLKCIYNEFWVWTVCNDIVLSFGCQFCFYLRDLNTTEVMNACTTSLYLHTSPTRWKPILLDTMQIVRDLASDRLII